MDDEPLVLALARSALERSGYTVLAAARAAWRQCDIMRHSAEDVGAVILDVTMPGMNG